MLFVVSRFALEGAFRFFCAAVQCLRLLLRGTGNIGVGAKDAAISRLWPKQGATAFAFIEKLAGVARHCLPRFVAAVRTGDR